MLARLLFHDCDFLVQDGGTGYLLFNLFLVDDSGDYNDYFGREQSWELSG